MGKIPYNFRFKIWRKKKNSDLQSEDEIYIYIYKQVPYLNFPEGNFEEKKSDLQENLLINYESQIFDSKFVNISAKGWFLFWLKQSNIKDGSIIISLKEIEKKLTFRSQICRKKKIRSKIWRKIYASKYGGSKSTIWFVSYLTNISQTWRTLS